MHRYTFLRTESCSHYSALGILLFHHGFSQACAQEWACISNTLRINFSTARRRRRNSKQLVFIVVCCAAQLEQRSRLLMTTAPSCTLGDIFGARSCGAQLSGMTLAIKGNKSADATTPLRRTARAPWRADQNGPNWHAIPVQVPLANTENEKNENRYRQSSHFENLRIFFSQN